MVTGIQLLRSIDSRSLDLSKAQFSRSNCASCLHNTDNANIHVASIGAFQAGKCLFSLCAQHDANDAELLGQRTVIQIANEESEVPVIQAIEPATNETDLAPDVDLPSDTEQAQFYLGEPDAGEVDTSDDLYDQRAYEQATQTEAVDMEPEPLQMPPAEAATTDDISIANDAIEDDARPAPVNQTPSYIEVVKNAWWRDALVHRVAESGSIAEMQGFLNACFASGYTIQSRPGDTPVTLFLDIVQAKQGFLPKLVQDAIASLPLDVIHSFLIMFGVNLADTGTVSIKLLCAHTLDELATIADELQVPDTDEVCDAYANGSEAFAHAIFGVVGERGLSGYIPHSIRP